MDACVCVRARVRVQCSRKTRTHTRMRVFPEEMCCTAASSALRCSMNTHTLHLFSQAYVECCHILEGHLLRGHICHRLPRNLHFLSRLLQVGGGAMSSIYQNLPPTIGKVRRFPARACGAPACYSRHTRCVADQHSNIYFFNKHICFCFLPLMGSELLNCRWC